MATAFAFNVYFYATKRGVTSDERLQATNDKFALLFFVDFCIASEAWHMDTQTQATEPPSASVFFKYGPWHRKTTKHMSRRDKVLLLAPTLNLSTSRSLSLSQEKENTHTRDAIRQPAVVCLSYCRSLDCPVDLHFAANFARLSSYDPISLVVVVVVVVRVVIFIFNCS